MRVQNSVVPLPDTQRGTHVSVAATLQVRLQQQALHLAAFGLLLALDLVQWRRPKRSSFHDSDRHTGQPCLRRGRIEQGVTPRGQSSQIDGLRLKSQVSKEGNLTGLELLMACSITLPTIVHRQKCTAGRRASRRLSTNLSEPRIPVKLNIGSALRTSETTSALPAIWTE